MRAEITANHEQRPEPTLAALLTHVVRTVVPLRLYQLLHLAFPLAVDFAFHGWWRPAAWATAVTAFGAWGLADRWLWSSAEYEAPNGWLVRGARVLRAAAGTVSSTLVGVLLLELFLRVLGTAPIS
jgi:hypothetical protein